MGHVTWHEFLLLAAEIKISLNTTAEFRQHNATENFDLSNYQQGVKVDNSDKSKSYQFPVFKP